MASLDSMAPWDAFSWFDTPIQTDIALQGVVQTLVPADVRRVVLVIMQSQSSSVTVGIRPDLTLQTGHLLNPAQGPIVITQAEHGPLCQMQWFVFANIMGNSVSVIEVKLRDWPRPGGQQHGQTAQVSPQPGNRLRRLLRRAVGGT